MGRLQWDRELDLGHLEPSIRESGTVCMSSGHLISRYDMISVKTF